MSRTTIPAAIVPPGELGCAKVERFVVDRTHLHMREMVMGRAIEPGEYTRLFVRGALMMSDTPAEKRDLFEFVHNAKGDILVTGLGLGIAAVAAAAKPSVRSVTVIELEQDVAALVGPHMPEKVTVIVADALSWRAPPKRTYDAIWHDIWPDICADNLPNMSKLKRRYARRAGWQGCWCESESRHYR